ncbi:MAG: hypothetical protein ACTSV5_10825 [Promethearchaeota archaeon]
MSEEKEELDDSDDELDRQWEMQDKIHHKCKIRDDPEEKQKKWKEKYGN